MTNLPYTVVTYHSGGEQVDVKFQDAKIAVKYYTRLICDIINVKTSTVRKVAVPEMEIEVDIAELRAIRTVNGF